MPKSTTLTENKILNKIYSLRGHKVMLDFDLAELYAVETKQLKRQVKRNIERFPSDFMFLLSEKDLEILRRQFGTSSWGGSRYLPMAFTEQGVAMLSSILNSPTAIKVNIQIIRVFTKVRQAILTQKDMSIKFGQFEKILLQHNLKLNKHGEDILLIFQALKKLLNPPVRPRTRIGFRRKDEQD